MQYRSALMWFRRDLRAFDNAALHAALTRADVVHCVFVFDRDILDALPTRCDRRVAFIHASVAELQSALQAMGGSLHVLHDSARAAVPALAAALAVDAVFTNHDYEPAAVERDAQVATALRQRGIAFETRKDQVIFERDEVLTGAGRFFSVYTPYKNAWLRQLNASFVRPYPIAEHAGRLASLAAPIGAAAGARMPSLQELGFGMIDLQHIGLPTGASGGALLLTSFLRRIDQYADARDFPADNGPSRLSTHLRFGTVSIRALVAAAWQRWQDGSRGAEAWLAELIWRDFYFHILQHNPHVVARAFKPAYDGIRWRADAAGFAAWCAGRTGYPLVDAGMRQLNQTGYLHNRLRMVVASFLSKDLLIDWRWGERYFAQTLNDYDLAANNGGWQWAASTGCDAQPYFRIFNPVSQSEKFDPDGVFIRRYVPEVAMLSNRDIHAPWLTRSAEQVARGFQPGRDYPLPLVEHATARRRALAEYKRALSDAAAVIAPGSMPSGTGNETSL